MPDALTPRQEIWRGLLFGQRSILLRLAVELKRDFGLPVPWYEALLALSEAPGQTMTATQLARSLLYTSGSASHLIVRLAEEGLVSRSASPDDARVVLVALTPEGSDRIERATVAHKASLAVEFEPLVPDVEVPALLAFARRIAAHEERESTPGSGAGPAR